MTKTNLRLAGLFAGVGGIELGFQRAGFDPIFANEIDEKASITYRLNHAHELVTRDVNFLDSKELPKIDVLTGGFPCQAFSVAGYQKGFKDPRGNVFWEIVRILEEKNPEIVFLENVKNLGAHDGGKTFRIILQALEAIGYHVKFDILNSDGYGGVPQNRERIYIVGFKSKKYADRFEFPDKLCPTLTANMGTGGHNVPLVLTAHGIRKLTPKECFNLMGFPKSFKLPKDMAMSHLYKQAGNAVVVPVIERIARNILASVNGGDLPSVKQDQGLILFK